MALCQNPFEVLMPLKINTDFPLTEKKVDGFFVTPFVMSIFIRLGNFTLQNFIIQFQKCILFSYTVNLEG